MPRSKKPKEKRNADKAREERLSEFWSARITAALEVKEDYTETARQVKGFMKPRHNDLFEDEELASKFMSFDGAVGVSVPKITQMKNSLAPRLYLPEPERTVAYRGGDPVLKGLARVLQSYLTYTAKETTQARELRQSIDDGLLRGRCFLRQIWDPIRKLITSVYVSSLDVVFDPDFTDPRQAQWVAIRHREPLWEVRRRIPKKATTKDLEKVCLGMPDEDRDEESAKILEASQTCRIVEWWEVLSRMGCGYRGLEFEGDDYDKGDAEDFVRLEVVKGHPRLLNEGPWDVPLHLDRDWPLSWIDFIEIPDQSWPESVPGQVLSCQGAVDLLTSLKLNSCKQRERVIIGCDKSVSQEVKNELKNGSAASFLEFEVPPGRTLDGIVKVMDLGVGCPDTNNERTFLLQEMETTMGSTQLLTGGQDSGPADRSATASNLRNEATDTRIGDFKAKVAEFYTDASRKEALMIRLFLDEKDVARYVRPTDLALFCVKIELPDTPPLPIRKIVMDGGEEPIDEVPQGLTVQDLDPAAANYFDTPEDAIMAAQQLWLGMQASLDIEIVNLRDALVQSGVDPMTGLPTGIGVDVVTAERVWQDTAGMTAEEIMDELSYSIGTSSGIKFNKQAERDNVSFLLQTLLPVVVQMGDIAAVNNLLDMHFEAHDVPEDKRVRLNPPAPMTPEQGGGEESGKKESKK